MELTKNRSKIDKYTSLMELQEAVIMVTCHKHINNENTECLDRNIDKLLQNCVMLCFIEHTNKR